jgi:hypothetical protein
VRSRHQRGLLLPVLALIIDQFPFVIVGFHSDNGSEYINHHVAKLLEKLRIEQTKSRSRHSNDNALAESKNASVVRKHMGYDHIPQAYAKPINAFYQETFNPWLNLHRPCLFATSITNDKGKTVKRYKPQDVKTPLERLTAAGGAQTRSPSSRALPWRPCRLRPSHKPTWLPPRPCNAPNANSLPASSNPSAGPDTYPRRRQPNDCRAALARRTNGCAICPPEALRAAKRTTGINIPLPPRSKPTRQDHLNAPRRNPLDFPFQPVNPHHRVTHSVAPSGSYLNWKILDQRLDHCL